MEEARIGSCMVHAGSQGWSSGYRFWLCPICLWLLRSVDCSDIDANLDSVFHWVSRKLKARVHTQVYQTRRKEPQKRSGQAPVLTLPPCMAAARLPLGSCGDFPSHCSV